MLDDQLKIVLDRTGTNTQLLVRLLEQAPIHHVKDCPLETFQMVIDLVNPFKQLITRFKSLLSTTDEESPQDNFLEALRQTLSEKDFKGSVHEIHPIHSQNIAVKKSADNILAHNSQILLKDLEISSADSEDVDWPPKTLKRVMSAPLMRWKSVA